jgi:hypothetical protein
VAFLHLQEIRLAERVNFSVLKQPYEKNQFVVIQVGAFAIILAINNLFNRDCTDGCFRRI